MSTTFCNLVAGRGRAGRDSVIYTIYLIRIYMQRYAYIIYAMIEASTRIGINVQEGSYLFLKGLG